MKLRRAARRPLQALLVFLTVVSTAGLSGGVASADPDPMTISMTSVPNPVSSGSQLTHTVVMTNNGGSTVHNAVMTDAVAGMTGLILQSSAGSCSQSQTSASVNAVTCSAGNLTGGQVWTVTIRGTVTAANGTTLQNIATVSVTKSAQTFTDNATTSTLVTNTSGGNLPDLTINISAPLNVATGVALAPLYTLTVNNQGTANANDIKVVDTLPPGLSGVTATPTPTSLFSCTIVQPTPLLTGTMTCTGGRVNAGSNATISINATTPTTAGTIVDTTVVDPDNTIGESNELNNTASVSTTVGSVTSGTLTITKDDTVANYVPPIPDLIQAHTVRPGDTLQYTLTITNTASTRADDVIIVDGTQGLDAASIVATPSKGFCVVDAPKVTCTAPSPGLRLAAGETMTVIIKGIVVASAGSVIFNTATVTGNIKNTGVESTATTVTTVKPRYDLTIVKTSQPDPTAADPSTIRSADRFIYTFLVGNSGLNNATGVEVRDPLPAGILPPKPGGFDFTGTDPSFTCSVDAANVLDCTGGTVLAEATAIIVVHVVAPETTASITNTATVDPNNTIAESDESNNTSTITTPVATGVDLVISKTDDAPDCSPPTPPIGCVAASGNLKYTIIAKNIGTQDAHGVVIRDTLPQGTIFRSASAVPPLDHNFSCSNSGLTVECINGNLAGTYTAFPAIDQVTIEIKVFAPPVPGPAALITIRNVVKIDPDNTIPEINESNNQATDDTTVIVGGGANHAFNDLTIQKAQTAPPANSVSPNGTLVYTISLGDDGSDTAFHVAVRDFLPTGSRFIKAENGAGALDGGFQCTQANGIVDCTGGTVTPTGPVPAFSKTLIITVFAPDTPGDYTNRAIVDPDNTIPEGNETNNTATVVTTVKIGGGGDFIELHIENSGIPGTIGDTPDPVATSGTLTYTMDVVNTGSDPAFNVVVRDTLPTGAIFRSAADITPGTPANTQFQCNAAGLIVTCSGATIDGTSDKVVGVDTTRTIQIVVFAPAQPGTYMDTAQVDPNNAIPEANETNNFAATTTVVLVAGGGQFIELHINDTSATPGALEKISDSPDPVVPGNPITYQFQVWNTGTDIAFNVEVRDVLPVGTTFVSATSTGSFVCSQAGGVVDCTGGALAGGSFETITIVVKAPLVNGVTLIDQAFVDPTNAIPEANETNNFASTTTDVRAPIDLTIKKEGPDSATQNSEDDYKITVTNNCTVGSSPLVTAADCTARHVEVHDPLPVGLIILNVQTSDPKFACQVQQNPVNVVDCLGDSLAAGESVVITIHFFMTAQQATYTNVACVDPNNTIIENDETNNCSTKVTVVKAPDLAIKKTAVTDPVTVGQNEEFDLHVANIGTDDATGVMVHDSLDPGLDYVSANGTNGFTCTFSAPDVTCTGDLTAGSSTDITIMTKVNSSATNPISNTATVDPASGEINLGNNSSSVTVSLGASGIDLVANTLLDHPDPVNPGQVLTYTGNVINTGTANATGVLIHQSLPSSGATFVGTSATNGFSCVPAGDGIDCTGNLNSGADTTITVQMLVTGTPPATLTSTVTADPSNTILESNETNNSVTATTTVSATPCSSCMDLAIGNILSSPSDPATIAADGSTPLTYTFAVGNVGDTNIPNTTTVTITDTLDANTTYVSSNASNGFSCSFGGATVTCTRAGLNAGQGTVVTIVVTVNSGTGSGTTITDSASVATFAGEFSTANNGPVSSSIKVT